MGRLAGAVGASGSAGVVVSAKSPVKLPVIKIKVVDFSPRLQ